MKLWSLWSCELTSLRTSLKGSVEASIKVHRRFKLTNTHTCTLSYRAPIFAGAEFGKIFKPTLS